MRAALCVALLLVTACGGGGGDAGTPPAPPLAAALTAPAHLADGLSGTVTVSADAAAGTAAVVFEIDGTPLGEDTTAPYAVTLDTSAWPAGQHVLRARARDAAGSASPWSAATVRFAANAASVPPAFVHNAAWITGLGAATAFAPAPDGRWFIAEQGGALRVVKNGVLLATPFVTLAGVDARGERGLIGVTLHPDFAANGWVYLHYTSSAGGAHNRVVRVAASPPNADVAAPGETLIVALPALSAATNHNGGALHFGTDGTLFVGVGDNADSARAQNASDPFGKLLRFNADGSIPSDNPQATGHAGIARAVWALGLRNPFTFAIQPQTGRLHINDVGQNAWEEINLGTAGANYGWPNSEGPLGVAGGHTTPLFAYAHAQSNPPGSGPGGFFTGFAIAGGAFYPASGPFPASYRGSYYFADFVGRYVGRLDADNLASMFARTAGAPVDLRVGNDGALYVLTRSGIERIATP
jgi:glucose/arabinose dehydrogenase